LVMPPGGLLTLLLSWKKGVDKVVDK